ncbi:MAG TPA: O-antigen ligase family protein [Thermoanaerobaculia bacterium]|jgi:O-antigen ligase
MQASRWILLAERGCLTIVFAWLFWLPLPFGSVVEGARLPLVAVPLAICIVAALLRLYATRDRNSTARPTTPWKIWGTGALLFLAAGLLQLIPLPPALLRSLSPTSHAVWSSASHVVTLAGAQPRAAWPITVDPHLTAFELLRLTALLATFTCCALLIRNQARRRALAFVICAAAMFEALYGLREAALQRYEIWGWVNRLVFDRVTGTFVNPNHFAHYLAIVLPMAIFLAASLWRDTGGRDLPVTTHIVALLERHTLLLGFTVLAALACVAAILLSQSRGALLALAAAFCGVAALLPGRRVARLALGVTAGVVLVAALALFLGTERTIARFNPGDAGKSTASRRHSMETAGRIWERFATFGSGHGTFERIVSMEQNQDLGHIYNHAHNDYLEIAATAGTLGAVIGIVALLGGYVALVRMTFGAQSRELSFVRRAFQLAALLSLTFAMVHALIDFNFFIPANPATLAAIAGAAVASIDHDKRTRR